MYSEPINSNGSLATLADMVRHYSEINEEKLAIAQSAPHTESDDNFVRPPVGSVLKMLNLSDAQIATRGGVSGDADGKEGCATAVAEDCRVPVIAPLLLADTVVVHKGSRITYLCQNVLRPH